MPSIEEAIKQLEVSAEKLKHLSIEESRALKDAVREATKEATSRVKAEYKEKKEQAKQEAKDAEKAIRNAQARIQKALKSEGQPAPSGTRAPRGARQQQFVDYVKANPGSKLADVARGIGVQASAANGLAKKAVADGTVVKSDDKRYTAA